MSEQRPTFCRICEAACGLVAHLENGALRRLTPDPDHVLSRGYACVKGVRYDEVHRSPDRLRAPLKRVGGGYEPISWRQALGEIGARTRAIRGQHGARAVGMYVGNPSVFSAPHPIFAHGFAKALGTPNFFGAGSQDCNNKFAASEAMFGTPTLQPVPDLDRLSCLIVLGSNPAISQMSFIHAPRPVERMRAIERRGGLVAFVDPRRTESARQVGRHVPIRPDTDVFFLLSFAHELLEAGGEDPGVAPYLDHLPALREAVRPWPAERTAQVTGVPAAGLRALVARYREADGAALYASTGVNQGRSGTLAAWLLNAINAVSGNLDRPGGLLLPRGQAVSALLVKLLGVGQDTPRSRVGGLPAVLGALPAAVLPDEILTPGAGQLRAMFVSAGNPLLSCPGGARMREAFEALELLVCIDLFRNETGDLAHYVLPATSFLERADVPLGSHGFQPTPYAQYTPAVLPPDGEQRDEWWIFTQLARASGVDLFGSRLAQRYLNASVDGRLPAPLERLRFTPEKLFRALLWASDGVDLGALRDHPHGKLLPAPQGRRALGKRHRVPRPGGRVDVAPAPFVEALAGLEALYEQELRDRGRLKLISKRERTSHNTWMHNVDALVRPPRDTNYLYMHPEDARRAGVEDGALVEVTAAGGHLRVHARLDADLTPGAVALPHGWGHAEAAGLRVAQRTRGVNANLLSSDGPQAVERLSGMAHLTGLPVEIRPVNAAQAGADRDASPQA